MALATHNITGTLKDALGGTGRGRVTFRPYASHDARLDPATGDVLLGSIVEDIETLPTPYTLTAGAWRITIESTTRVQGRPEFSPIVTTLTLDGDYSWEDILAGEVTDVPVTPTVLQQAQAAADEAEAAADRAQVEGQLVSVASIEGVDPTGAADSTAALNAWLDAPPVGATGLWFPPGTYVASLKVTTPGLTLAGSGQSTIKVPDNAVHHVTDAGIRVLADNVTIDGLTIDGNQTGNPGITGLANAENSDGIGIYADNCRVTNCHIYDPIGHGIIVWGLAYPNGTGPVEKAAGPRTGAIITGNRVEGGTNRASVDIAFNQGTGAAGETRSVIANNVITRNTFVLHTASDVTVTGNTLHGAQVHTGCKRIAFVGNVSPTQPINLHSGHSCVMSDNIATAFEVKPGTGTQRGTDNIFARNVAIVGTVTITEQDGIQVEGNRAVGELRVDNCTQAIVSGNRAPIVVSAGCTRATFANNQAGSLAISGAASKVRVLHNDLDGSTGTGLNIGAGSDIQAIGNRIRSATLDGITVGESAAVSNAYLADNVITGSGRYGIFVGANANTVRVQDNMPSGSTTSDITVHGSAVAVSQVNNGKAYGRVVVPAASTLAHAAPAAWPGANYALFSRFSLDSMTTLRHVRFQVGVSSGNIQVGVVRFTGTASYVRVMNSGIVACPAAGFATVDLGAYTAAPGDYGVFLWADNTTFTSPTLASDVARSARLVSVVVNTASGVPASGSVFESWNIAPLGISLETDV